MHVSPSSATTIALPALVPLWLKLLLVGIAAAVLALPWIENRCQLNDPRLTDDIGFPITDDRGAPITITRAFAACRLTETATVQFWSSWPPIEFEFEPLQLRAFFTAEFRFAAFGFVLAALLLLLTLTSYSLRR